jgi:hypothetical protein
MDADRKSRMERRIEALFSDPEKSKRFQASVRTIRSLGATVERKKADGRVQFGEGNYVTVWEDSSADLVERKCSEAEAILKELHGGPRRSPGLERAVKRAVSDGRVLLEQFEACADSVAKSANVNCVGPMRLLMEATGDRRPVTVLIAEGRTLVFACAEAEAAARIDALIQSGMESKKVPPSVAVKMVHGRLSRYIVVVSGMEGDGVLPVPLDAGRVGLTAHYASTRGVKHHSLREARKALGQVLHRPEVTDEVVDQALSLARVREVMES